MTTTTAPAWPEKLQSIPALCGCGCGQPAPLAKRNNARLGHVKGNPLPRVTGHNSYAKIHTLESCLALTKLDDGGCLIWQGAVNRKGYGRVHHGGTHHNAHRLVYALAIGQPPQGMHVDHLCRNKRCVNPAHMEVVTASENVRRQHAARRMIALKDPTP